jgi:hypothetical protein
MSGFQSGFTSRGGGTAAVVDAPSALNVQNPTYGATGNGVTDDTVAIQAALTQAGANGGGDVWVPYTNTGYLCGALSLPPGVRLIFENGAYLTAPASLATSWVQATAAVHVGTAVINGTFIASATTNAGVTAVIDFSGVTSCADCRIERNRIVNAPAHGIHMGESTGNYTLNKKWITENSVEGYGTSGGGYGIYCDYIGSVEIDRNYTFTTGSDDGIELGHSGFPYLGINAHLRATGNTVVNGQLQFPFSHNAEIIGNTVVNNTIQNDVNAANFVIIADNVVLNATPAAGYAGIRVDGSFPIITGNYVEVTSLDGISCVAGAQQAIIADNYIVTTIATGNSGSAINDNGAASGRWIITGNTVYYTGAQGFTYAFNLSGSYHAVSSNSVQSFDGITGGCTHSLISANVFNSANNSVVSVGTSSAMRGNNMQPVGVVTVAVPATGVAIAATFYDRWFYITDTSTGTTIDVGAAQVAAIAAGATVPVFVPAGQTMTPSYTTAPTWVCYEC